MLVKRIAVIVISLIVGAAVATALIIFVLGTTIAEYGTLYFVLTSFFLAAAVGIWLDKFLGTEFLPE
ncbi:MAG TPA: hypothetical protein VE553_01220 [Candidatus Binatia bacterium]|nr:hypothetical protein [Candidatus Binatia bacterium]